MPYVPVTHNDGDVPVELPLEEDSTLLLTTLQAAYPSACGLFFKCKQSGISRGVRLVDGRFHPPEDGWLDQVFRCTMSNELKRKPTDEETDSPPKKKAQLITDLIVLGLPWKTTEEQVKEYFQQFGEVTMATVKKHPRTGQSKGFGFVRFEEFSTQTQVIGQRHMIDGRWCDVKVPYSQSMDASQACKIFVGQLQPDTTQEDIKQYFSDHGDVTDVYVPQPFRQFAFVTFSDPFTAKAVCAMGNHNINGAPVNVSVAIPPTRRSSKGSPYEQKGAGWPNPNRFSGEFQFVDQNFFNTSGEWNSKQGRNSMLWDESSWDTGHYSGYTTVRGMGF